MTQNHSRFIDLQGCVNFRDIGGYRNRQGQTVAWRKVFRSASLHLMTGEDTRQVYQTLGVVTLIDLRNSTEIKRDEYRSSLPATVNYRSVPFLELHGIDPFEVGDDPAARLADIYLWILFNSGQLIADALNTLADEPNLPALFQQPARTALLLPWGAWAGGAPQEAPDSSPSPDWPPGARCISRLCDSHASPSPGAGLGLG